MRLPIFGILYFIFFMVGTAQSKLINIASLSPDFSYEIRYATTNNFVGVELYDCGKCLLQTDVAEALHKANLHFLKMGYKIKVFDCYRPLDIQKKMWEKVPNAAYVANPYGKGSIHNRGAAVDLTLVTLEECELDMGTDYDFFGREAHIDYLKLSDTILQNRKVLLD